MGLSAHVLDTTRGAPAEGIPVTVERLEHDAWHSLAATCTDADGRCAHLLAAGGSLLRGRYRIRFETAAYFARQHAATGAGPCFYPYVEIVFDARDDRHHHIPLLIAANGYTTYRGS